MRRLALLLVCASGVAAAQPPAADPTGQPAAPPVADAPVESPVAPPDPTPVADPAPTPPPVVEPPRAQTETEKEMLASYEPTSVTIGGYLQPQYRFRQESPAQFDQDGFKFARARLLLGGATRAGNLELSATVEAELQPQFAMLDAYASVARTFFLSERRHDKKLPGKIQLDGGQMRTPISRQQMLSDSRLSFVDKAQIATIAPDRDLGAKLTVAPPGIPAKLIVGVFDGEGKNQVENINQSFLYAARLEISPYGRDAQLAESAFVGKLATVGLSYGHNKLTAGNGHELVGYLGADVTLAWKGISAGLEYLVVKHEFEGPDPAMLMQDFQANGWAAQLAYLLPLKLAPLKQARLEIAARIEEIDRNDTIPIPQLGDPNQSVREITGVVTYYLRMHSLKAQLAFNHFQEIEDRTVIGGDATYDNDQLLLQVTYRLE